MRMVSRTALPQRSVNYLARKQAQINGGKPVQTTWDQARQTKSLEAVASILASMSGVRQRCMFCGDSRSTDIEHFWPKANYPLRVFRWDNLLWICTGCNRKKGNRFLLDRQQRPLLIDPTAEDPWDFLFYDASTGNISAKYDPQTGKIDPKGEHTVDPNTLPGKNRGFTLTRDRRAVEGQGRSSNPAIHLPHL